MKPTVSVVMSVYNGGPDLPFAIDSILAQSFADFEFIIINDGSTDDSLDVLRAYEQKDARIKLIDQDNTGLTVALRRGVAASQGEYVARMDADDLSMPSRLGKQVDLLRADESVVMVSCHLENFRDDGSIERIQVYDQNPRLGKLFTCFFNPIGGHGQIMYRRTAYEAAGGYDPDYNLAEDYDLWTRILDHGELGIIPEILYRYRVGHESVTSRNKTAQVAITKRIIERECGRMIGEPIDENSAHAILEFWWQRHLDKTPIEDARLVSDIMDRVFESFFVKNPHLAHLESQACQLIASRWRWRFSQTAKTDLRRCAFLLGQTLKWRRRA